MVAAAGQTNGTPKGSKVKALDAQGPNGTIFGSDTGRSSRSARTKRKSRGTYAGWVIDKGAKLLIWYCLITALFRCPASQKELKEGSPPVCKPYLQAKDYIQPHVQPYYDNYLAPHVQKAQPYVDRFNKQVYNPGLEAYQHHGAPRIAQAQKIGIDRWEKTVKPQLDVARHGAEKQYDAVLGPHVKKAQGAVQPYVDSLKTSASDIWELEVQPVYRTATPYAQKFYKQGHQFAVETALPQAQYAGNAAYALWIRQIWPRLRVLYGENVEPQLMRITERLGRYKAEKKLEADIKSAEASSTFVSATSAISSSVSSSSTPSSNPRQQFLADLDSWKSVSSTAVEEGAEHLKEHIKEITDHQIKSQADGVGNARVTQLEETVDGSLNSVKARILSIVAGIPEEPEDKDYDTAHESLTVAIRNAGQNVKKYAQAVREWRQNYDNETSDLVQKALESTLETIDNIRELRLTDIGRNYASSSIPHKDWTKYNNLKKATKDWRDDVNKVVKSSKDIKTAEEAGKKVEGHGMSIAEDAAKELGRLKEVGKWKIEAQDATDDFETKTVPPSARRVKKAIEEQVEAASEAVGSATESIADYASDVSEAVVGSSTGSFESVASKASSSIIGTPSGVSDSVTDSASSISSAVSDTASSFTQSAASAFSSVTSHSHSETLGPEAASIIADKSRSAETPVSSVSSAGEDVASSVSSAASEASGYADDTASEATDYVSESVPDTDEVYSAGAKASSRVFGGAMAQSISSSRGPILDDTVDDLEDGWDNISGKLQSAALGAQEQASILSKAVADAIKGVTTTQGAVESVTSVASQQYESAISAASAALFGTTGGVASKGSQAARDQYLAAVTAASQIIYGTPTTAAIAAAASSKYSEALAAASSHFDLAKSRVSAQVSGTPKPVHEQMFSSVDSAYSDAVAAANSHYTAALGALPTGGYFLGVKTSQGAYESLSSLASVRLQEGLSVASAQYQTAKIAVGAEPTPAHQAYLASARRAYYEGVGLAHDQYSSFVDAGRTLVGDTSVGYLGAAAKTYSSAIAVASSNYDALVSSARSAAGVTKKSPAQSVLDDLSSQYDAAVDAASQQLAAASSHVNSLIYGTTPGAIASASSAAGEAVQKAASQASANWEALVAQASSQVYGTPPPFTDSVYSQAGAYAAQATSAAAAQYDAVQSLFSELVSGREPDFTDSVFARFSSAYYTGAPNIASAASSYASGAYESASSVITSVFTPPPTIEAVLNSVTDQLNSAVDAASVQFYGSSTGAYESATSAAASAYTDAASRASEAVYGTQTGYAEAASSSISLAAESASRAISEAFFGTSTGTVDSATNIAADKYSSISSAAADHAAAASSAISSAIYGPEKPYLESAQLRLNEAIESARTRIGAFAASASGGAADGASKAQEAIENIASSVSSAAAKVTRSGKDEL